MITRRVVTKYRTEDGGEFLSELEAREHEIFLETRGLVQTLLPCAGGATHVGHAQVARALIDHAAQFSKAYGSIRQKMTRLKQAKQIS